MTWLYSIKKIVIATFSIGCVDGRYVW